MTALRTRVTAVAIAIATVLGIAGCGGGEDPEEVPAVSMSRAEVVAVLNANMRTLDPEWHDSDATELSPGELARSGCGSGPGGLPSDGPPWSYRIDTGKYARSQEQIASILHGMDMLEQRGFSPMREVEPLDPRDRSLTDTRKFTVGVFFGSDGRVSVSATSPCVRHPDAADDSP